MRRSSSYLQYSAVSELGIKPLKVWAYDKRGRFVCRLEINRAGIAVSTGKYGTKRLLDTNWEKFVKRLQPR